MTISSIGTSMYGTASGGTQASPPAKGGPPDFADIFNKLDQDASGSLDQAEFSELAEKLAAETGTEIDVEELFATYDEDGDGTLSSDEAETALEANRPDAPPPPPMAGMVPGGPDLAQMFTDADEDESGSLDATETETLVDIINQATGQDLTVDDLIAAYDEDEDGTLSEDETVAALEANRPEGPPPPPPGLPEEDSDQYATAMGIENYLKMAALGTGQESTQNGTTLAASSMLASINTQA